MGNLKRIPLITLCIMLAITCLLVYRPSDSSNISKEMGLQKVFGPVAGYRLVGNQPLEDSLVSFLELDDYTMATYHKGNLPINLYIGYYYTLEKVSAAHSPLVCFPGQGWIIDRPDKRSLMIENHTVHYAEMTASLEGHQELVLYWYQADDDTAQEVYRNKINAVLNKLSGRSQEHAFVRISVPYGQGIKEEQAREEGLEFITKFYPSFLRFVNNSAI